MENLSEYKSPYKCEKCGKTGRWRSGPDFDYMMRCSYCEIVWTPHIIEYNNKMLEDSKINVNGDGI